MSPITVLLVDNQPRTAKLIRDSLQLEFEVIDIAPNWILRTNAITARRTIREDGRVDVALVDLYLSEDRLDKDGVAVIKEIRARNQDCYILAMTGHPDWSPSFRNELEEYVTHAIDKDELRESGRWNWSNLAQDIREYLIQAGRINIGSVTYDYRDAGITSVLESVGRALRPPGGTQEGARALRVLASRCLGEPDGSSPDINISYLTSGRSGATVCRLDMSEAGRPSQAFIMKFGLDRRALERERHANNEAGKVLSQQSLMATVGKLGTHGSGYHAIAARVADNAVSLRQWLGGSTTTQARALAEIILCEQLGPFYRDDGRQSVQTADWVRLSPGQRLRARTGIDRYGDAIGDPRAGAREDDRELIERLTRFIDLGEFEVESRTRLTRMCAQVRIFGDLHSENILVQPGVQPRPVLIDASLYGHGHWSSDNARLLIDLLLRVRQPGVEAMLWPEKLDAGNPCAWLCPDCETDSDGEPEWDGTPVDAFMARAVELLPVSTHRQDLDIHHEDWHLEWHVGLAREFLRQSTYQDLTPPRACLALVAAAEHLRIASEVT